MDPSLTSQNEDKSNSSLRQSQYKRTFDFQDTSSSRRKASALSAKSKREGAIHARRRRMLPVPSHNQPINEFTSPISQSSFNNAPGFPGAGMDTTGGLVEESQEKWRARASVIQEAYTAIASGIPAKITKGLTELQAATVAPDPVWEALLSPDAPIELLAETLGSESIETQRTSLWIITNLTAVPAPEQWPLLKLLPAAPLLVSFLRSPSPDLCEMAAWAIGNLAWASQASIEPLRAAGALKTLSSVLLATKATSGEDLDPHGVVAKTCFAICGMLRSPNPALETAFPELGEGVVAQLNRFAPQVVGSVAEAAGGLARSPTLALRELLWLMAYVLGRGRAYPTELAALMNNGVGTWLVVLAQLYSAQVKVGYDLLAQRGVAFGSGMAPELEDTVSAMVFQLYPVIRGIGGVISASDDFTDALLSTDPPLLPTFLTTLHFEHRLIRKETCWVLSNIAAGPGRHVQALVHAGFIPPLATMLSPREPRDIRFEAAYALAYIAQGGQGDVSYFSLIAEANTIPGWISLLDSFAPGKSHSPPNLELTSLTLDVLRGLIEDTPGGIKAVLDANGAEALEHIVYYPLNDENPAMNNLRQRASFLINNYLWPDDDEDAYDE